jgi:hypothetical protein
MQLEATTMTTFPVERYTKEQLLWCALWAPDTREHKLALREVIRRAAAGTIVADDVRLENMLPLHHHDMDDPQPTEDL